VSKCVVKREREKKREREEEREKETEKETENERERVCVYKALLIHPSGITM
jgi:tRNA splicing endonuclease